MPNTKIVATLGPATDTPEAIRALLAAGVNVFRLNASHGSQQDHARRIEIIRQEAQSASRHIGILLDLQGPKIRLGKFSAGPCDLKKGARFVITTTSVDGNCDRASTGYASFVKDVKPGNRVLINDGAVDLKALSVREEEVEFEVIAGGTISDHKGINLPGVTVSAPSLTPKDLDDLEFALSEKVDLIALSFVRSAADIDRLRERIGGRAKIPIIAKIEKPEGVENIVEIVAAADGVMVARGDLGVEMDLERVPPLQKSIIRKARRGNKFVITATQMLESMTSSPVPTRAEVSDVANAIWDGTDAVMLSAETSTGKYPVEAVQYMERIAVETEKAIRVKGFEERRRPAQTQNTAEVLADAAYNAARCAGVAALVVFTSSGTSARLIARYRPPVRLFAITPDAEVARRLSITYGVEAIVAPNVDSTDEMLSQMDHELLGRKLLRADDLVVFVAGQPVGRAGTMNLMKVHRLGEGGVQQAS